MVFRPDENRFRILVIDDRRAVLDSLCEALTPVLPPRSADPLAPVDASPLFAVERVPDVAAARSTIDAAADEPFAVVFLGVDRLATSVRGDAVDTLLAADPALQLVLIRDDANPTWSDLDRTATSDRLVLAHLPLARPELRQLTAALAEKWRLGRAVASEAVAPGTRATQLEHANESLKREISERKAAEELLRHHAYHDPLTGLANRELLLDRLERCIRFAKRMSHFMFAVVFLDIDNFKVINDSLGHSHGDELLVAVTRRLTGCLRDIDTVVRRDEDITARFGGDEFVILLEGIRRAGDVAIVSERLLEVLSEPFELNGHEVVVSASIGVAIADASYTRPEELLRDADIAMYRSKAAGKARYTLFDPAMHEDAIARLKIESDLRRAIEKGDQFHLVYQPIVDLRSGKIRGFEALIRWDHPERGPVSPDQFIYVAEETGLIVPLGWWVLNEACRQLRAWDDLGGGIAELAMNVNVSRRQLTEPTFYGEVRDALEEHQLPAERLNLEITESAVIEKVEESAATLRHVKELGVGLHMDDFGTGYSSLSCLHRFPLDVVKIDRAFMETMGAKRDYAAVVHGIITIAHNLGMQVTAEGLETPQQVAQILALDCDFAQGYIFSKPLSGEDAARQIRSDMRWRLSA